MADPTFTPEQGEIARKWIDEIGKSETSQNGYRVRGRKIIRRYKDQWDNQVRPRRFNILWSNTETLRPVVYSRPPAAVVTRRFKDADPVARAASEVLERALAYHIDKLDLDGVLRLNRDDYILLARGCAWERYVPTHGAAVETKIPVKQVTDDGGTYYASVDNADERFEAEQVEKDNDGNVYAADSYEPVIFEESQTDHVAWDDFGTNVARTWEEVSFVWRRVYMDREQLESRFGKEIGSQVPLDWSPNGKSRAATENADQTGRKAAVYELWDKCSKKVFWISRAWGTAPLDEVEDPLGLDGFFPCPRPMLGTCGQDSTIPVPDYILYQDQAEEVDELTARIASLIDALKVKGFYSAAIGTDLDALLSKPNNTLNPINGWASLKDDGGLKGLIEWMPLDQIVSTIDAVIATRKQIIDDIYQLTGISDIMRGTTDPRETAEAQAHKADWGTIRVRDKQKEMARFARDILRIKAEVIAEKFSAETLETMTGVKLPRQADKDKIKLMLQQQALQAKAQQPPPQQGAMPGQPPQMAQPPQPAQPPQVPPQLQQILDQPTWEEVIALLRDNNLRQFRIDVETDSTIEPDQADAKQKATELLGAVVQFAEATGPIIQASPQTAPMFAELLKWAVRQFNAPRALEDVIETTMDKLANSPPPSTGQADNSEQVAIIEQQTEQMIQQGETQRAQLKAQETASQIPIKQADQQLKLMALQRDPTPQAAA